VNLVCRRWAGVRMISSELLGCLLLGLESAEWVCLSPPDPVSSLSFPFPKVLGLLIPLLRFFQWYEANLFRREALLPALRQQVLGDIPQMCLGADPCPNLSIVAEVCQLGGILLEMPLKFVAVEYLLSQLRCPRRADGNLGD